MKLLFLILMCGCTSHAVETGEATISTKGWPVVAVHIEGPGGDRTTVPFEVLTTNVLTVNPEYGELVAVLMTMFTTALLCWALKTGYELGKKG